MAFNTAQFRECIVRPVLKYLEPEIPYSMMAEELLMLTAAQESHLGTYLKQVRGPALGVYQMEPATHHDLWINFIQFNKALRDKLAELRGPLPLDELVGNLFYATAMARVHYFRVRESLPSNEAGITALARYWKYHYNTVKGAGRVSEAVRNYKRLVLLEGE